jgi:hypothetical protein
MMLQRVQLKNGKLLLSNELRGSFFHDELHMAVEISPSWATPVDRRSCIRPWAGFNKQAHGFPEPRHR